LIVDPKLMRSSLWVIGGLSPPLCWRAAALQPGTIALLGAAILMLLHNLEHHRSAKSRQSG